MAGNKDYIEVRCPYCEKLADAAKEGTRRETECDPSEGGCGRTFTFYIKEGQVERIA